jgi:chemotaxis signal transduction protein
MSGDFYASLLKRPVAGTDAIMLNVMEQSARTLRTFSSGANRFAVYADEVMSIVDWREPAALPYAPAAVLGVVSIQGRMLTVLDLLQLLEQPRLAPGPSHILALRGDEQLALAIDAPGEAIVDGGGDHEADPAANSNLISRVVQYNGDEVSVLNVKELFATAIQGRERRRRRF